MYYLVKSAAIPPTKKGEDHKAEVFNILCSAISYTDAEATATKFFEDNLKDKKYKDFKVSKIGTEAFNLIKNGLGPDDDIDFAIIYKAKVSYGYEEDGKKQSGIVLVLSNSIEEAGETAREYLKEYRNANFANLTEIKETTISPLSPLFHADIKPAKGKKPTLDE